jgi:serine/threonine protein kinase
MQQGQTPTYCPFLASGSLVGNRYRIVRTLGAGGMASVYLAEDEVLGGETQVALKILKQGVGLSESQAERFLREVRLTHKINHENVVRTFDFGQEGDTRFYTMEYLQGKTLTTLMQEQGQLPIDTVLRIALQVLKGIAAIHQVGVTHRDIKPDNIMVIDSMRVKITDFGVARGDGSLLTLQAEEIIGTIAYLSPETLLGQKATTAIDYYSFAAVLYELLTGHLPIEDDNPARIIMRKIDEIPPDPRSLREDIPDWLSEGILNLLDPDPVGRMNAVKDFLQALVQHAPAHSETDLITASIGVHIADLPTKALSYSGSFQRVKTLSRGPLSWARCVAIAVLSLLAVPVCTTERSLRVEYEQLDNLFRWRGQQAPHQDLVMVSIDEPSYSNLQVPMGDAWPRRLHAKLLRKLEQAGAKKVIFDVLFINPSSDPLADQEFADAISRIPTILGASLGLSQQTTANGSFSLEQMIRPLPLLEKAAAGIGIVGLPQFYGRLRGFYAKRSELFPDVASLAEAASDTGAMSAKPGERDLLNYYGPASTIRRFSYHDVIADEARIPEGVFRDKRVFIGLNLQSRTGPSQREAFGSPFDARMFGTEVHATATSNLLMKDWIRRLPGGIECAAWFCLVAILISCLAILPGRAAVLALVGIIAGACLVQYIAFLGGVFLPVVSPMLLGAVTGVLLRIWLLQNSQSKKRYWA